MKATQELEIHYTNERDEAHARMLDGYEPIECAFGGQDSVMGPLAMDHHGAESWREGVALRACRDHYGARRDDPRFVVTGTPDADATLAIIALAALVPQDKLPADFYELVNRHDIDPIDLDLLDEPCGEELLFFQQTENLRRDAPSFHRAINVMCQLLRDGLTTPQRRTTLQREERRIQLAEHCIQEKVSEHVLLVESRVWGFDRWYRNAPVVVSFSRRFYSITIGCRDIEVAQRLLGTGGLMEIFGLLGKGWGGRETVGGSPRGERFSFNDARRASHTIAQFIQQRLSSS